MSKDTLILSNGYRLIKEDWYLFLYDSNERLLASCKEHGWNIEPMHLNTARKVIETIDYIDSWLLSWRALVESWRMEVIRGFY